MMMTNERDADDDDDDVCLLCVWAQSRLYTDCCYEQYDRHLDHRSNKNKTKKQVCVVEGTRQAELECNHIYLDCRLARIILGFRALKLIHAIHVVGYQGYH